MRMWFTLVLGAVVTASSAWADATSIKSYVAAQIPNNTTGAVTPANIRNSFNYLTDNLSTVPYTGQIVTSYPITGTTIRASNQFIGDVSATNISATSLHGGLFTGDGSGLTGVMADSSDWYDITSIPAAVQAVSNSTSLTMSSITADNVSVTSNISADKFIGDGSLLTNLPVVTPTWASISGIPTGVQNISNSTGSVTATTFTGTYLGGTLTTAAQPNVTSVGTLTGLTVNGIGTFTTASATNVNALSISGTNINGHLTTAAQTAITSVGTLSNLAVSGNITGPSLVSTSSGGIVSASLFYGDGSHLTGVVGGSSTTPGGANTQVQFNNAGIFGGSSSFTWDGSAVSTTKINVGSLVEGVVSTTATTPTTYLNAVAGDMFYVAISSNTTINFTNGVPGKSVQIFVKQDATGGRAINYVSPTFHWNNQLSPTLITSGSTVSQWSWTTYDGSSWFGGLVGSGM